MHVEGELYLWMMLLRVVIVGASNLFVPPMCQERSGVNYTQCYGQQFETEGKRTVHSMQPCVNAYYRPR